MNRCGGCTLCCDLLAVPVLEKAANQPCQNCEAGAGCRVWENRLPVCKNFQCLWYANPRLPDALRPDRCGVLLEPVRGRPVMMCNVDPERAQAWREGIVNQLILKCLGNGYAVVVIVGSEKNFLLPSGVNLETVWKHVSDVARETGFVR